MFRWLCKNIRCIYYGEETPSDHGKCCFCLQPQIYSPCPTESEMKAEKQRSHKMRRVHRNKLQVGDRLLIRNKNGHIVDNALVIERIEHDELNSVVEYKLKLFGQSMDEDESYEVVS